MTKDDKYKLIFENWRKFLTISEKECFGFDQGPTKEPLQYSGIKTMGYLKPWAPAFSYGLFVKYDNNLNAIQSYHSRTNGFFHGTNSLAIDKNGKILVSSTGDGKIGYLNG